MDTSRTEARENVKTFTAKSFIAPRIRKTLGLHPLLVGCTISPCVSRSLYCILLAIWIPEQKYMPVDGLESGERSGPLRDDNELDVVRTGEPFQDVVSHKGEITMLPMVQDRDGTLPYSHFDLGNQSREPFAHTSLRTAKRIVWTAAQAITMNSTTEQGREKLA